MINSFRKYISVILLTLGGVSPMATAMVINVNAGDAATICFGENLDLTSLGATISGDVDDGIWFSTGDGQFLPGNGTNVVFSVGTYYLPGPNDLNNGTFDLILVSDDPDGIGPMTEVSDMVTITLMTPPAMVSNNFINVSLSEQCEQEIDVFMLMANPQPPYSMYIITLLDENNDTIPNNTLTAEHISQEMTFIVGHSCTNNISDGSLTASDNIAPFLNCIDVITTCSESSDPESTGFPIPFFADAVFVSEGEYTVNNFDACGPVTLTYIDDVTNMDCVQGLARRIERQWHAEDPNGNTHSCSQTIRVEVEGVEVVVLTANYNGIDSMSLECDGDWDKLSNGYPSPTHTGFPIVGDCGNIESEYTDLYFNHCGGGFKIIRRWTIIDWCTSETINNNQIIEIRDSKAPVFECPGDTIVGTDAYSCVSDEYQVMFMEEVYDCSEWTYEIAIFDENGIDQSLAYVSGTSVSDLPPGEYTIEYSLTDACLNNETCTSMITVIDDKVPFAICQEYTVASIQNLGEARVFATSLDQASYDNCGIVLMEVAKMTDVCGHGLQFGSYVDFCCGETGDSVMVQFRVTDANGLSNTCMVTVKVQDKIDPEITCPSDMTVSCDFEFDENDLSVFGVVRDDIGLVENIIILDSYNNGIAGTDGDFYDNCGAELEEDATINLECGTGTITRKFTATDSEGRSATCTQRITFINDNLLTSSDISWPQNHFDIGCDTLDAAPEITGVPSVSGAHCSQADYSYEDHIFYNAANDACIKILRYWTLVDWCQFDQNTGDGKWEYIQEIKLKNTEAPVIADCSDQLICDYDDCGTHELSLSLEATDDCTDTDLLTYNWSLDVDNDGSIDASGQGSTITRTIAYGEHRVYWSVADGCGNSESCDYLIEVEDCKLPTPYCQGSITTTVMPSSGAMTIWASDFNLGGEDNCTDAEDLVYSFSSDVQDTSLTVTCADIENGIAAAISLEIWITDLAGNQDYCSVQIIIQDNGNICPDGNIKGRISGIVKTPTDELLRDAAVVYDCIIDDFDGEAMTDDEGRYNADDIPEFLPYGVRPRYEGGIRGDVNSIDLVHIQRHILRLDTLETPYDIIAADINRNKKIQPSDLLALRKFILQINEEFTKAPKWDFIPANYVFPDSLDPFDYIDSVEIDYLSEELDTIDFVAIRIGNVDGNFTMAKQAANDISGRSAKTVSLRMQTEELGNEFKTDFYLTEDTDFDALQLSVISGEGNIIDVQSEVLSPSDYYIKGNIVNVVHVDLESVLKASQPLFSVVSESGALSLAANDSFESFLTYRDVVSEVALMNLTDFDIAMEPLQILQNPFTGDLPLLYTSDRDEVALVNIYNVQGAKVGSTSITSNVRYNISSAHFSSQGAYIIEVISADDRFVQRVIRL